MRTNDVNLPVYFDDLKVTHTNSPVIQKGAAREEIFWEKILARSQVAGRDYPFGLSFNSYTRPAITAQNFKFNAGSELESMTDWYSTPFRKYDPSLGRFHGVDALADLYTSMTPSHFAGNNPIMYNDPTGLKIGGPASEARRIASSGGGVCGTCGGGSFQNDPKSQTGYTGAGSQQYWNVNQGAQGPRVWNKWINNGKGGYVSAYEVIGWDGTNQKNSYRQDAWDAISEYEGSSPNVRAAQRKAGKRSRKNGIFDVQIVLSGNDGEFGDNLFGRKSNNNEKGLLVDMEELGSIFDSWAQGYERGMEWTEAIFETINLTFDLLDEEAAFPDEINVAPVSPEEAQLKVISADTIDRYEWFSLEGREGIDYIIINEYSDGVKDTTSSNIQYRNLGGQIGN